MANPEELKKQADTQEAKKDKPLPALVSPTVNLVIEIRQAIALRCRETGESFSIKTNKMWLGLLKAEKRVKPDLEPDFTVKRIGGLAKKVEEKDAVIADLQKQIAALKASKA